jgi:hypothetical protein
MMSRWEMGDGRWEMGDVKDASGRPNILEYPQQLNIAWRRKIFIFKNYHYQFSSLPPGNIKVLPTYKL